MQVRLKLNGARQLLVYTNKMNILGDNATNKYKESFIDASKKVDLEVNAEKPK
jgi:hypothetical protein